MTLVPKGYKKRVVDGIINDYLKTFGAVYIKGPKYCGKTWTALNHSNSQIDVSDSEGSFSNAEKIRMNIDLAIEGDEPHLIDEWQIVPKIWDKVRNEIDKGQGRGRFILTGSSDPSREDYFHSGAGRFGTIEMSTMTLWELGLSSGDFTIGDIAEGAVKFKDCKPTSYKDIIGFIIRGGWPNRNAGLGGRNDLAKEYIRAAAADACRIDGVRRDLNKMNVLIRSLARNESTMVSDASLKKDMMLFDDENISPDTLYDYLDCLRKINILVETPTFRPNIRSEQRIGKTPKRHLADVSLSVAAMGINERTLSNDRRTMGFLFESLCEHDLRVYAEAIGGKLFHYRDGRGREIDAVVELEDGRWIAIEIKLSLDLVDDAADKLIKLNEFFKKEGTPPCALCVLCGVSDATYKRPDGVIVMPVTALGP